MSFAVRPVDPTDPADPADLDVPWLTDDPVRRTLLLGVLAAVRRGAYAERLAAVVTDGQEVLAAGLRTPPHNLLVEERDPSVDGPLDALLAWWAEHDPEVPGVTAMEPTAHRAAAAWSRATGRPHHDDIAERLFRLDRLVEPRPVPGRAAPLTDLAEGVAWMKAFAAEAGVAVEDDPSEPMRRSAAEGRLWVWEDGAPVCLVGRSVVHAGVGRVGPVWTPPQHRGHGYASALTAYVSRTVLDEGATPVLFTDLANPTSNRIYRALGYTPVGDAAMVAFT